MLVTNSEVYYYFLDKFILTPTLVNLAHNLKRAEITFNDELNCHFLLLLFSSEKEVCPFACVEDSSAEHSNKNVFALNQLHVHM